MQALRDHPYRRELLLLLRTSMTLFIFTVVVGILNGTDVVTFERQVLLTHLHAGTLGWITLSVFAACLWTFGGVGEAEQLPRVIAPLAAGSIVLYAIAFLTTTNYARPILGTLAATSMLLFLLWAIGRARRGLVMSVPRWGLLGALATSVTGGVLGVLLGILIASNGDVKTLPADGEGAHPATMVVGFLIPAALSIIEWLLRPDDLERKATRAGFTQMVLLFLAGLSLMVGVLTNIVPLIILNLPFEIAAIAIFFVRNRASLFHVGFGDEHGTASPFLATSSAAILLNLGMLIYLLGNYADDFDAVPRNLILALDHVMFIGVMTNSIFGLHRALLRDRSQPDALPWADKVVFALVNVGIAGFYLGFMFDAVTPKRIFTPLMGTGILLGIYVSARRSLAEPVPVAAG
jgi:hypothetical protein